MGEATAIRISKLIVASLSLSNKVFYCSTNFFQNQIVHWGDGLAQWLERWTGDPKVEGSNPARSTTKLSFSESKRLC